MEARIKLGVSSCLLGQKVRYDGGHKLDPFLTETLGAFVDYVPVCPEVEMGLPTPREALRQIGDPQRPRLVTSRSGVDWTEAMVAWSRKRVAELEKEGLCGFIFKNRSPSSGMERVKVYDANGIPHATGVGIFARIFMEHFPLLPVEEEGRLHDPRLRENFIESIFTLQRWRELLSSAPGRGALVDFHSRHKLLLLAHGTEIYRSLGRLVASAKEIPFDELLSRYQELLLQALRLRPTVKKHVNVLQHMMGYFKRRLAADEKRELLEVIEHYRQGLVPLIVPLTLLGHYVRHYDEPYLKQQFYLYPHPIELRLRNHV